MSSVAEPEPSASAASPSVSAATGAPCDDDAPSTITSRSLNLTGRAYHGQSPACSTTNHEFTTTYCGVPNISSSSSSSISSSPSDSTCVSEGEHLRLVGYVQISKDGIGYHTYTRP